MIHALGILGWVFLIVLYLAFGKSLTTNQQHWQDHCLIMHNGSEMQVRDSIPKCVSVEVK